MGNLLIHHWMLALYDERAQQEVWGTNPEALIASGIAYPQGSGRLADGGFVISGRWNFSSGVNVRPGKAWPSCNASSLSGVLSIASITWNNGL